MNLWAAVNVQQNITKRLQSFHQKVSIHYGDSDDDVLAAKEAGVRGIRLMRPQTLLINQCQL